eukprot:scaffold4442_cov125-Amphora_coffeaeformis.AAC.28
MDRRNESTETDEVKKFDGDLSEGRVGKQGSQGGRPVVAFRPFVPTAMPKNHDEETKTKKNSEQPAGSHDASSPLAWPEDAVGLWGRWTYTYMGPLSTRVGRRNFTPRFIRRPRCPTEPSFAGTIYQRVPIPFGPTGCRRGNSPETNALDIGNTLLSTGWYLSIDFYSLSSWTSAIGTVPVGTSPSPTRFQGGSVASLWHSRSLVDLRSRQSSTKTLGAQGWCHPTGSLANGFVSSRLAQGAAFAFGRHDGTSHQSRGSRHAQNL